MLYDCDQDQAFLLTSPEQRAEFEARYKAAAALYYQEQIEVNAAMERIKRVLFAHNNLNLASPIFCRIVSGLCNSLIKINPNSPNPDHRFAV